MIFYFNSVIQRNNAVHLESPLYHICTNQNDYETKSTGGSHQRT